MKSFKTYLKEKASANNASFAAAGSSPATKFSGVMGFGSVSGDSPSANKPRKGDGKDITPEITAAIADGVKRNEIVKDETTGALQFRGLDGTLFNSPHAAIEGSFASLVRSFHANGSKNPMVDAEITTSRLKMGLIKPIFDKDGKYTGAEERAGDEEFFPDFYVVPNDDGPRIPLAIPPGWRNPPKIPFPIKGPSIPGVPNIPFLVPIKNPFHDPAGGGDGIPVPGFYPFRSPTTKPPRGYDLGNGWTPIRKYGR
tara:strand:- start:277 stop:1041 length:765 start_codon:yes stop_codon:yes gene_type:complete